MCQSHIDLIKPVITKGCCSAAAALFLFAPGLSYALSLEQVFKNLILNAIDAMDGCRGKRLNIRTELDSSGNHARIQVQDTGCGVAEPILEKLFTPYFSSKPNGNGLGLAVVKNVVKQHKGSVSVQSIENKGATFTVCLPLAPAASKRSPTRSALPSARQSAAHY